jgi:uncharacterized membrane protein YgdD (TMEM256/DUF423 family)
VTKVFLLLAAVFGFLGVAAGAFGAHALEARLSDRDLSIFETAVRYLFFHALALGLVGTLSELRPPTPWLTAAGWAFVGGILVFSGSLFLLVGSQWRWLGAITPLGGLSFLAGWALLALDALRR